MRLVAVDMDGTFLDSQDRYDRQRFAAVHARLRARDIACVVASGNQYWQLKTFFEDVPDVWYIAENGGLIATDSQVLRVNALPPRAVRTAVALLEQEPDVVLLTCGVRAAYVRRDADPATVCALRRYYTRLDLVASPGGVDDPIVKLTLTCPVHRTDALVERLARTLPEDLAVTSSGHGSIDLIGRGCHKGDALAWLGRRLGVAPRDMVAFGDGGNDIEMFRLVGHAVAMADAPSAVTAHADQIAGSHTAHGVLIALEAMLAREAPGA